MADSSRRVLITGASGLLGRAIMKLFSDAPGWEAVGLAHSRVSGNLKQSDLLNFTETQRIVEVYKPHILIHSAAERRPDIVSKNAEYTNKLNFEITEFLSKIMESLNSEAEKPRHSILYISTDYVFDGTKPPYKTDDPPNPLNKYGESKWYGEEAVRRCHSSGLILRVPVLYGDVEFIGESAVTGLLTTVQDANTQRYVDDYHIRFPTLVDDVAKVILFLVQKKCQDKNFSGTFHWSGDELMTKFGMATKIAEAFNLGKDHLLPDKTPPSNPTAARPFNCQLDCGKLEELMGDNVSFFRTSFTTGITKYLNKFVVKSND